MIKIAILYICIGNYDIFWKNFYTSSEKYFLCDCKKEYYVFTDSEKIYEEENENVHKIYQENLGWPGNTLYRFKLFSSISQEITNHDYVFFLNANTVFAQKITREEFLPAEDELLVVKHPGFYNKVSFRFPYERRRKSLAYIPYFKGRYYVFGAVNGGATAPYLKMIEDLKDNIDNDFAKGIIAKWHDESHLNRYIYKNLNYRILDPSYAYPEDWDIPFEPKIHILNKEKRITLSKEKLLELENRSIMRRIFRKIRYYETKKK